MVHIKKKSNKSTVNKWLKESSKNKFSFYGQNASLKMGSFDIDEKSHNLKKPEKYSDLIEVINIIIESKQKIQRVILFLKRFLRCHLLTMKNSTR